MKRSLKLVVSLAITIVSFWFTFRNTQWDQMWASLRTANWWVLPQYVVILALIHLCRTLRWGNLLSGIEKVKFAPLNEASAIGFMMLLILPLRLGEFARPFLIAERSTIRRSAAMTSVVLERIVDGMIIAALLRALLFFVPEGPDVGIARAGANVMFMVFGGGLVFLIIARWQHDRTLWLIRKVFGLVSPKIAEKVVYIVDGFVGALRQLPDAKNLAMFFLFTAAYWGLNGWGMSVLANAFDCHTAGTTVCAPLQLTVFQGFVVLSVLIVGMMIPGAPASAGMFQWSILLGIGLFVPAAVVNASGVAYANVLWLVQISQQILLGLVLLVVSNRSFRDIAGKLSEEPAQ